MGEKTVADYVADGGIVTKCVNYNKESGAHVIYDGYVADKSGVFGAYYDYQIVLTGLTSLSNEALDLRGVEFTIAFYTTDNNGTVYHDTYTTSYNAIAGIK